jgi:hypothetical protein
LFVPDGDYMDVYLDSPDHLFASFVQFEDRDRVLKELRELLETNACSLNGIAWPRRADGAMDYPPPLDMSGYKPTHRTIDKLRLRDTADTSSLIVTTLPKDTDVQVVESGPSATINGITAPWVKVVSGSGYTGWCFSGYLEALAEAATPENPGPTQETSAPTPEAAATAKSAGFPVPGPVLFIVLGGLAVVAGAAVFLVIRRKR